MKEARRSSKVKYLSAMAARDMVATLGSPNYAVIDVIASLPPHSAAVQHWTDPADSVSWNSKKTMARKYVAK